MTYAYLYQKSLRVKIEDAPLISHEMPVDNVSELSLKSVIVYNLNQIGIAQRCLFGSEKVIDFMSKLNGAMNCMKDKRWNLEIHCRKVGYGNIAFPSFNRC